MTLFLGGGGDKADSIAIDSVFFEDIKADDKILYIPIACDFTSYKNCFEWFCSLAQQYIPIPSSNITMLLENDPIPDFSSYKAIYIGGGNTYKLLDYIATNNLKESFEKFLQNGGKIFGGSAGAIIFGSTIETVAEEKENYPDNKALCFLKDFAIRCHYVEKDNNLFAKLSSLLSVPIIAIPENGGIIINHNKIDIIGELYLFKNGQKYNINILKDIYIKL